jgi:sec-independent protein translocase protein TatC
MNHLEELRTRLVVSSAAFFLAGAIAFVFFVPITDLLLEPLCSIPKERLGPQGCRLIFTGPVEPMLVRLKISGLSGMVLASPIWLYQLWAFVSPGLSQKEKRYSIPFVGTSILLFLTGITFAYLTLPAALRFLVGFAGENFIPFFSAKEYLSFVTLVTLVFGITFELPLLLFFLGLIGVVKVEQLRSFRRGALVTITLLAAIVTPSQDPFTMLAMALPLYLMYELVILGLGLIHRRKKKKETAGVSESP